MGTYVLCALGTKPEQLSSCSWGQAGTEVRVGSGPAAAGVTLNVRTGALVTFSVSDPSGRIQLQNATATNARQTNVAIGVVCRMGHYFARLVEHSGTQWKYAVAVPVGAPVFLWLQTRLKLVDQTTLAAVAKESASYSVQAADASGVTVNLAVQ